MEASRLLQKFSQKLFDSAEQARFIAALIEPQPFHPCILWLEPSELDQHSAPFTRAEPLEWQPDFVERLELDEKPGKHPLHQQGKFYCLDFSSVFAASVLLAVPDPVRVMLDVCASPGGKSLFAWRALQPQQLLCNEVIGKRLGALLSNLKRCQVPATAFSLDSSILAVELTQTADLVLVDAPCTGQSLLAKGEKNPGCFHPVTINKNANRQKRILANSAQTVAPSGYLAYMTCAYSPEENEQVVDWLLQKFPQFQPVEVPHLRGYQSQLTDMPCYRMFPQDGLGAGAFTILLQNGLSQNGDTGLEAETKLAAFLQRPKLIRLG